ncbi:hypothetical protein EV361DRAFT_339366 [Lentinula raphanica]|nr:hypothetical protein EV361DRAFT_339366 [Lentinula raphanica]
MDLEDAFGLLDLVDNNLAPSSNPIDGSNPLQDVDLLFQGPGGQTFTAVSDAEYATLASQIWDFDLSAFSCGPASIGEDISVPFSTSTLLCEPILMSQSTGHLSLLSEHDYHTSNHMNPILPSTLSLTSSLEPQHLASPLSPVPPNRILNRRQRISSKPYTVHRNAMPVPRPIKRSSSICVAPTFTAFCETVIGVDPEKLIFQPERSMSLFRRYERFRMMRDTLSYLGLTRGATWKALALITITYSDGHQETLTDILQACKWRERTWNDKTTYFEWAENAHKWSWDYEKYPSSPMVHGSDYVQAGDLFNHWQRIKYAFDYPGYFTHSIEPKTEHAGGQGVECYAAELTQETLKNKRLVIGLHLIEAIA